MQARRQWALGVGVALTLGAAARRAHAECGQARSVELEIAVGTIDAEARRDLERLVTAELRASDISVCSATAPAELPATLLAHVGIHAASPELEQTTITVRQQEAAPFERTLELGSLPSEARPLAVASAADELLRSVLAQPAAAPHEPTVSPDVPPDAPAPALPAHIAPADVATEHTYLELGLAGAASSHFGEREALGADLLGRFWPTQKVALTLRVGGGKRLSRPVERGWVQAKDDLHAAFAVGLELLPPDSSIALLAEASMNVLRIGFDELPYGFWAGDLGFIEYTGGGPLDSAWALVGSLGAEGRVRAGPIAFSAAIAGLVPLVPATSDWAETTSLKRIGAEVRVGIWVPLAGGAR